MLLNKPVVIYQRTTLSELPSVVIQLEQSVLVDNVGIFTLRKGSYIPDGISIIKATEVGFDYYYIRILDKDISPIPVTYAELKYLILQNKLLSGRYYIITDYRTVHKLVAEDGVNAGQQSIILIEDFAGGPSSYFNGYFTYNNVPDVPYTTTWLMSAIRNGGGVYSVYGNGGCLEFNTNASITTQSLNTAGTITFQYREKNNSVGGTFKLWKSINDGAFEEIASQTFQGTAYQTFSFDVNEPSNNVKLKITSLNPTLLLVDELSVTDYVNTDVIGEIEPLLVLATSTNTLDSLARSFTNPLDIIHYSFFGVDVRDRAFFTAEETPINGFVGEIYFRKDTIKNVALSYDFREVNFSKNSNIIKTFGENYLQVYNVEIGLLNLDYALSMGYNTRLNGVCFLTANSIETCHNIKFGNNCYNILADSVFTNNSFGNNCYNNTFLGSAVSNNFGNSIYENTFGGNFSNNSFGDLIYDNIFGVDFIYNVLGTNVFSCVFGMSGNSVNRNTFGNSIQNCTFSQTFENNIIGSNYTSCLFAQSLNNVLGSSFSLCTFGAFFNRNMMGSYYNNVSIGAGNYAEDNIFGSNWQNVTIGSYCQNNKFGSSYSNVIIGSGCYYNSIGSVIADCTLGSSFYKNTVGNDIKNVTFNNATSENVFETTFFIYSPSYTLILPSYTSNNHFMSSGINNTNDFSLATHLVDTNKFCTIFRGGSRGHTLSYVNSSDVIVYANIGD